MVLVKHGRHARTLRAFAVLLLIFTVVTTGCQTFNLTDDEFQRQQRGETLDSETGKVVETVGTFGYYGAAIGAAVAALSK